MLQPKYPSVFFLASLDFMINQDSNVSKKSKLLIQQLKLISIRDTASKSKPTMSRCRATVVPTDQSNTRPIRSNHEPPPTRFFTPTPAQQFPFTASPQPASEPQLQQSSELQHDPNAHQISPPPLSQFFSVIPPSIFHS